MVQRVVGDRRSFRNTNRPVADGRDLDSTQAEADDYRYELCGSCREEVALELVGRSKLQVGQFTSLARLGLLCERRTIYCHIKLFLVQSAPGDRVAGAPAVQ